MTEPKNQVSLVTQILIYYRGMRAAMNAGDFEACDRLLRIIPLNSEALLLLGGLRILYPVRDKVPYWELRVQDVYAELHNRGLDATTLLQGLYAPPRTAPLDLMATVVQKVNNK